MEELVFSELTKQKGNLKLILKDKYGLNEEDFLAVTDFLEKSLTDMIKQMKNGKSAHEKFFSDIILNSIDAIIGLDTNMKIFLWNKGAEKMFGYSREEAMGRDFSVLIPDYLIEQGEKEFMINELKERGYLENYDSERRAKDGSILNVNMSRFSLYDSDNNFMGSVGIHRNMTKERQLEKQLREKENLALIGEVVSSIAHSFSNPINIISGNADYLLLDKKPEDEEYEELKIILEESAGITKSIRHLLDFSRPVKIEKEQGNINKMINDFLSKSKYMFEEKRISVRKCFCDNLPVVLFGETEMQEVISNLFNNAVHASSYEDVIKVKTSSHGNFIYIDITDNGDGIPKENLNKIFTPFFSSKSYGKGTGLGLSIAKKIVSEHGGELKVKSNIGKGTSFTISLPLK